MRQHFYYFKQIMKKSCLTLFFLIFLYNIGENATRKTYNLPIYNNFSTVLTDTIIPGEKKAKTIKSETQKRSKSIQSKDYSYGKNNLLSFLFATLAVFCLVLLIALIPLNLPFLYILLYIVHAGFVVMSFFKGLKGIKEEKMKILGYIGLLTSGCFSLSLIFGLFYLSVIVILFILGG